MRTGKIRHHDTHLRLPSLLQLEVDCVAQVNQSFRQQQLVLAGFKVLEEGPEADHPHACAARVHTCMRAHTSSHACSTCATRVRVWCGGSQTRG